MKAPTRSQTFASLASAILSSIFLFAAPTSATAQESLVYTGKSGPGQGKHIVFLTGDEEYRSEEGLTMLARIMAERHGFKCTVLFTLDPKDGTIDAGNQTNMPGLQALDTADLCVMLLRFREFPDADMKHFVDYFNAGKPFVALRTATHSFSYDRNKQSPYAKFDWRSKEWEGGFGQQVLGDTWISHHGDHGKQSTRGVLNPELKDHPILRGVTDVWGPTDVYGIAHLPADATVLLRGQVLEGMKPEDKPLESPKNNPMMPIAWAREYKNPAGKVNRIFTTTMGASVDLESEGLRRLVVNASYWAIGLADKIPSKADVSYVGEYKPTWFGFNKHKRGVKPLDLRLP